MVATITCLMVPALALVVLSGALFRNSPVAKLAKSFGVVGDRARISATFAPTRVTPSAVVRSRWMLTSPHRFRSFVPGMFGLLALILGGPGAAILVGASGAESSGVASRSNEVVLAHPISVAGFRPEALPRPAWVDEMPSREGRLHTQTVSSDPHVRLQDAYRALDAHLKEETDAYIRWYLASDAAPHILDLDIQYIKQTLRSPDLQYVESREYSVGPMNTMYARLEFDERFREELDQRWRNEVSKSRLWITALTGGGVFLLLLTVFGYFRLDTATRGYYTGRLQLITVAAILALLAAGFLAAKWVGFQWL